MQSFCGIVYLVRDAEGRRAEQTAKRMLKAGAEAICFATHCALGPIAPGPIHHRRVGPEIRFWPAIAECEWFAGGRACMIARADEEFDADLWPLANRFADNDWKGCVVALAPQKRSDTGVSRRAIFSPPNSERWIERFETLLTVNTKFGAKDSILAGVGIYDAQLWDFLSRKRDEALEDDLVVPHAYLHDRSLDYLEIDCALKRH